MKVEYRSALKLAERGGKLSREHILALLQVDVEGERELFNLADRLRQSYVGSQVHLRGIIEFSNHCRRNCLYCGLRRDNSGLARYRMTPEEIFATARQAAGWGYRTLVLQSGEDTWYTGERLAGLVALIKQELGVAVTLSVGDRERWEYQLWREAGADRYLMKHETADPELFVRLRPGTALKQRVERLTWLRQLGYQVGSGFIAGLPGQTIESLADDLILLRQLEVEMAGIGPFIPNGQTPLADAAGGTVGLTLRLVAIARLLLPWAHLPATTALGALASDGRQKALQCGANVVMPNVTPVCYREHYRIYPNKICRQEDPESSRSSVESWLKVIGRKVDPGPGHSPKPGFRDLTVTG